MRIFLILVFLSANLEAQGEVYNGRLPDRPPPQLTCRTGAGGRGAWCEAKYVFPSEPRWSVRTVPVHRGLVAALPLDAEWARIEMTVAREDGVWELRLEGRIENGQAKFRKALPALQQAAQADPASRIP